MGTERIPALTALDDSAKPWRLEADKLLRLAINHKAASPFLGIARMDPRLYKASAGDNRGIEFRIGEPNQYDTSDGSTLAYSIKHNASGELEVFAANGTGIKLDSTGKLTVTGTLTQPLPGFPTILSNSFSYDPPSIAAGGIATATVTVTGASTANNPVVLVGITAALTDPIEFADNPPGFVTGANTVSIRFYNNSAGSVNHGVINGRVIVFQY